MPRVKSVYEARTRVQTQTLTNKKPISNLNLVVMDAFNYNIIKLCLQNIIQSHRSVCDVPVICSLGMTNSFSIIQGEIGDDIQFKSCVYTYCWNVLFLFYCALNTDGFRTLWSSCKQHILLQESLRNTTAIEDNNTKTYILAAEQELFFLFMPCPSILVENVAVREYTVVQTNGEGVSVLYLNNDDIYLLNEGC